MIFFRKKTLFGGIILLLSLWSLSQAMKSSIETSSWQEFNIKPYTTSLKHKLYDILFSPNEKYFCGTENSSEVYTENSNKKFIHLWEISKTRPEYTFSVTGLFLNYFFSSNGKYLVIKEKNQTILYSTATHSIIKSFTGKNTLTFFPETDIFSVSNSSSASTCKIFCIKLNDCTEIKAFTDVRYITFSNPRTCHECFAGVLYQNNNLEIFEVISGCQFQKKILTFNNVYSVTFVPFSPIVKIIFNDKNSTQEHWNVTTKQKITWQNSITFSPNKTSFIKVKNSNIRNNQQLEIYNRQNKKVVKIFKNVIMYSFSESGKFLGICVQAESQNECHTSNEKIYIFNMKTQKINLQKYILNNFNLSHDTIASKELETMVYFSFLNCDNFVQFYDEHFNKKIFHYTPKTARILFNTENNKNETQKNNIKNFYCGKIPQNVKFADMNCLFKK